MIHKYSTWFFFRRKLDKAMYYPLEGAWRTMRHLQCWKSFGRGVSGFTSFTSGVCPQFCSLPEKVSCNSTFLHKMHLQALSYGADWAHFVSLFSVFIYETLQPAILSVHERPCSRNGKTFCVRMLAQTLVLWTSSSFVMKEALQNETSTDMIVEGKIIK